MFAVSGLAAILFLGGWNGPVPVARLLGLDARATAPLAGFLGNLPGHVQLHCQSATSA